MRKQLFILIFTLSLSFPGFSQLEIRPESFKEVYGFVNINTDKMYDENDKPYAVLKIKTENISSKERRELTFKGDAQTFFEVEYQDGEIWLYISYYASFIKISHDEFSSTEFTFPYDMKPKCGYELTLVNKAKTVNSGWASLTITTQPETGAEITLNGRELNETTPYTNNMLPSGKYEIVVAKDGFKPTIQSVDLQEGDTKNIDIEMPYDYGQDFDMTVQTFTVNSVTFEMIPVKGGTFIMGCTDSRNSCIDNELPPHKVTLNNYFIGKYEVTKDLWMAIMGHPKYLQKDYKKPVDDMNWNKVHEFIEKLNQITGKKFRLPTEAEWEYAARGGNKSKGYKYSGSDNYDEVAWYDGNSKCKIQPVGTKKPNELGIYDMSGNVWEWCQDVYGDYSELRQFNPTGSKSGTDRVYRGGSCERGSWYCRIIDRNGKKPNYPTIKNGGFRLVLDP